MAKKDKADKDRGDGDRPCVVNRYARPFDAMEVKPLRHSTS